MIFLSVEWTQNPEIFKIAGVSIRWYSLMFVLAFVLGLYLMKKIFKRDNISEEKLDPLFMYTFISMLIGMRLGEVFFYNWAYYQHHLLEIILPIKKVVGESMLFGLIKDWKFEGFRGFASHGAAIAIIVAMFLYSRKHLKKNVLFILDRLGIVVALGGFFVRLGNFFNSEIYGKPTNSSFGVIFKLAGETEPRHPTQLYEAFSYLILFFILWYMYWKTDMKKKLGALFGIFMIGLWSLRLVIEYLKEPQVDGREDWLLGLNTGQVLSVPLILIGVWLLFRKMKSTTESV